MRGEGAGGARGIARMTRLLARVGLHGNAAGWLLVVLAIVCVGVAFYVARRNRS